MKVNFDDAMADAVAKYLEEADVRLNVRMPSGTMKPKVTVNMDTAGMGPVVELYILMQAVGTVFRELYNLQDSDGRYVFRHDDRQGFVNDVARMFKESMEDTTE